MKEKINALISKELYTNLIKISKRLNKSIEELISIAITEFIENKKDILEEISDSVSSDIEFDIDSLIEETSVDYFNKNPYDFFP
ncbi:MAG: hypothetical protein ACK4IX_01280 [Candidatus Sericytochromatia bacterium]